MIAAIRGFIPALDRRLSIAIKSGIAAKVVPKPATTPKISDRLRLAPGRAMRTQVRASSLRS
jgi:hypothetical protein